MYTCPIMTSMAAESQSSRLRTSGGVEFVLGADPMSVISYQSATIGRAHAA